METKQKIPTKMVNLFSELIALHMADVHRMIFFKSRQAISAQWLSVANGIIWKETTDGRINGGD